MNRSQRRKAGKTDKVKTYVLTQDQIDQLKQDATEMAFRMFMSVPVMVLHDKFGFGRIRGQRFMDYALVWYESIQKGEVKLTEVMDIAEKYTGVQFIMDSTPDRK